MANGSRRSWPMAPAAAAVVSEDTEAPRKVPCCQSKDSVTSGTAEARRPPNRIAETGTPFGSSHSGAIVGHCQVAVGGGGAFGEDPVAVEGLEGVGVGVPPGAGGDAEKARLGVDRVEPAVV